MSGEKYGTPGSLALSDDAQTAYNGPQIVTRTLLTRLLELVMRTAVHEVALVEQLQQVSEAQKGVIVELRKQSPTSHNRAVDDLTQATQVETQRMLHRVRILQSRWRVSPAPIHMASSFAIPFAYATTTGATQAPVPQLQPPLGGVYYYYSAQ